MRVLIVGLGSIGRRHLANLKLIEPAANVTVWHQRSKRHDTAEGQTPVDCVVYRLEDALETRPDVALITGPTSRHVETGLLLARHESHLFIEKPLSNRLDGVDELIDLCRARSLVLMVGYNFRFYRPLQLMREAVEDGRIGRPVSLRAEVGQYLPEWRPGTDYRQSASASEALGGGVVLELSHELDYARWLVGEVESVSAKVGRLGDLGIGVEDTAEIILGFADGAIGSVHLNMVQRPMSRTCRVIGTRRTLVWDGLTHRVQLFSPDSDEWLDLHRAEAIDHNEMFTEELRHFLQCVRGDEIPAVDGYEGRRVLEIAMAAKRSAEVDRTVKL